MIVLRPKQTLVEDAVRDAFQHGYRSPLLVSPTGSGKTVIFSDIAAKVSAKGKRIMILVHREELLDQVSNTLRDFSVHHSYIAAARSYERRFPVHVASVFTLAKRVDKVEAPDLIIIDEAHHAIMGSTWGKVLAAFPKALRLGVTATPQRLSGEGLNDLFDTMIVGPGVAELIADGSLSKYEMYAPSMVDLSDVHSRMGDYAKEELAAAMDKSAITGNAVQEYRKRAHGKRAVAFCVNLNHAEHVAAQFRAAGYRSARIDGNMDRIERRQMVRNFSAGNVDVLTSCDLISEGFDLPAIEVAILLRPTQSLAVYLQQCGRALRTHPGKEFALLLDHAGNFMRHGLVDEEREWSLEGRKRKKRSKEDEEIAIKIKQCPRCYYVSKPAPQCPNCGHVYTTGRKIEEREGELQKVTPAMAEAMRRNKRHEVAQARTLEDLQRVEQERQYKPGWARFVWEARQKKRGIVAA